MNRCCPERSAAGRANSFKPHPAPKSYLTELHQWPLGLSSGLLTTGLWMRLLILVNLISVYDSECPLALSEDLDASDRVERGHARPGWMQGRACRRFLWPASAGRLFLFRFGHRLAWRSSRMLSYGFFRTIFVIGCISKMTGMRLFKLGGPGRPPDACDISKNSDPSICTGTGGW
jgi:hypothetical protein